MNNSLVYRVRGLDCIEEVGILKKQVGTKAGVLGLEFDILNARMTVTYDAEQTTPEAIVEAVAATGMSAVPWEQRAEAPADTGLWQRHSRLIMASASGVFLLSSFILHWLLHGSFKDAFFGAEAVEGHGDPPVVKALYVATVITGAWFVVPKAIRAARSMQPDMNLLMMIAVAGALAIGQWFEASTVAFLFALALLLEEWSVGRARRSIARALDITPRTARTICPHDGDIEERRVEDVAVGAVVLIRPGERIPLDGEVIAGSSHINQAPITGESKPVRKTVGDEVYAGTINEDGALEFRVTKQARDTMLARIVHMVEEAQTRRAPSQRWVDRFAFYYTPAVMILAVSVMVGPPLLFGGAWSEWFYRGLVLLVISCPCALVISTPVTIVSGLASAAHHGVLIKGGMYLEAAGRIKALCFDKTGTLTHGHPEVQEIVAFNGHSQQRILEKAAALEAHSQHPLAKAILRRAAAEGASNLRATDFISIKGKGAEADLFGRRFWIGSHRLMDEMGQETPDVHNRAEELEDAGHSVVALGNSDHVCGLISVADRVREHARTTVADLKQMGLRKVVMLTGDNEGTARAVAEASGVDAYLSELLPDDKVEAVGALVREYEHVAMVGDGVNDAPAMAASSFGIAMGAMGTDAAIETADVALMSDELEKIPWLIGHSRRTFSVVKQNITFALSIKAVFIIMTLFGLATLWMAVAADMGASLAVIFNGLRMLRARAQSFSA